MFVLMKIGRYAGEVREVEFAVGRDLIATSAAEQVFHDDRAKPPVPVKLLAQDPAIDEREAAHSAAAEPSARTTRRRPRGK